VVSSFTTPYYKVTYDDGDVEEVAAKDVEKGVDVFKKNKKKQKW